MPDSIPSTPNSPRAQSPVDGPHTHLRRILIPIDADKYARYAADWAVNEIVRPGTDYAIFVHVVPKGGDNEIYESVAAKGMGQGIADDSGTSNMESLVVSKQKMASRLMTLYKEKCDAAGIACKGINVKGDARKEIKKVALSENVDMVVLGHGKHTMVEKAIFGSTSEWLTRNLRKPVVLVRLPRKENSTIPN